MNLKWDTREPCGSCPYRRDAPLGLWHPSEFENLVEQDSDPMNGKAFGCHATVKSNPPSVCAGWLFDQRRRGVPSIQLRLCLIKNKEAVSCLKEVSDGGHALYESIGEMVEANFSLGVCVRCGLFYAPGGGEFCSDCEGS